MNVVGITFHEAQLVNKQNFMHAIPKMYVNSEKTNFGSLLT